MGMQCDICGKKPVMGNQYARRGKAKYLGGVGRKVTGISRRTFRPNLQRIQVEKNGTVKRLRVCRNYATQFKQVNPDTADPPANPLPIHNVFRDDEPAPSLPVAAALANAPDRHGDFYGVPAVLD